MTLNREKFPGLNEAARFDGPAGSQLVLEAAEAIGSYLLSPVANAHGGFPPSDCTDRVVGEARDAVATMFGTRPQNVAFGPSMTALNYRFVDTVSASIEPGDEIVCTRLDHEANVGPWRQMAEARSARVRIAEPDPATLELTAADVEAVLGDRTRWVAVTAASNACGSMPDLAGIIELSHAAGAKVVVDAVHAAPHTPIEFDAWGADALLTSAYKWFGPHGSMLLLSPELRDSLHPRRLNGLADEGVDQWELGALSFEQYPGIAAAARYVVETGFERVAEVEEALLRRLLDGLGEIDGVAVYGEPRRRTSTVLFNVGDRPSGEVAAALRDRQVYVWHGHFLALELMDLLDLEGAVRAGILHYNSAEEVDRLLEAVADVAAGASAGGGS